VSENGRKGHRPKDIDEKDNLRKEGYNPKRKGTRGSQHEEETPRAYGKSDSQKMEGSKRGGNRGGGREQAQFGEIVFKGNIIV